MISSIQATGDTLVIHGDLAGCPPIGSVIEVTVAGAAVFRAAHTLYEAALASDVDLSLPALQMRLTPPLGEALFQLFDACHDLLDR